MSNISYDIGAHEISSDISRGIFPLFEIAANPTINISEVKSRRFYIVDRAQSKAKEEISRQEKEPIAIIKPRRVINSIFEVDLNE